MRKILAFLLLSSSLAYATAVSIPTTYTASGTVTATNLNGNFTALATKINGGLDNDNADTTNGYHFFRTVSSLPAAGTQGNVFFLTSDNTLNLDSGSAYIKSISTSATPAQGDVLYYTGSAWTDLAAGTSGYFLKTQGAGANPAWTAPTATDLSISSQAQGDVLYYNGANWTRLGAGTSGQVLKTSGAAANPSWANGLSSVSDYGTSASASTARQATAVKVAYGQFAFGANGSQAITNLPFSSSTSFAVTVGMGYAVSTTENIRTSNDSGAQFTLYNDVNRACTVNWIAVGT